jgi:F-type H+-transporting ATPase subunit b
MLLDAEFWVAVAFVLFMGVVWKVGGFAQITKALDTRGRRVRSELDEAQGMKSEAEAAGAADEKSLADA